MALPTWPAGVPDEVQRDGLSIEPMLAPIKTEMDGGNVRLRARAGDNVAVVQQSILMLKTEYDALVTWGKNTIGNWTGRFTTQVWLGSGYASKVCQFQNGSAPKPIDVSLEYVSVSMTLRVYDV